MSQSVRRPQWRADRGFEGRAARTVVTCRGMTLLPFSAGAAVRYSHSPFLALFGAEEPFKAARLRAYGECLARRMQVTVVTRYPAFTLEEAFCCHPPAGHRSMWTRSLPHTCRPVARPTTGDMKEFEDKPRLGGTDPRTNRFCSFLGGLIGRWFGGREQGNAFGATDEPSAHEFLRQRYARG